MDNLKKRKLLFSIGFFGLLFALIYIFPYSGDDWAWGSSMGLDRLHIWFADYNGRYLGNLLVLALTRSLILKTVVITGVLFGLVYLTDKYTNTHKKNNLIYYVGALLILALPRAMMMQSVVWTAGFSNYVPPIFLILVYLVVVNNIFKSEKLTYSKILIIPIFILGICASLFMEHVTIYSVVLAIAVIIYTFIKFKKVYAVHVSYFLGALLGAIIMFSNGAYRIIATTDSPEAYRTMAKSTNIGTTIYNAVTGAIYQQLSFNNVLINTLLTILLIVIMYKYRKRHNRFIVASNVIGFILVLYTMFTVIQALNPNWQILLKNTAPFEAGCAIVFYITLIVGTAIFIEEKGKKAKTLFLVLSLGVLTGPLFFVTPIGPRCFFPMYVIYMLIIGCYIDEIDISFEAGSALGKVTIVAIIGCFIYLWSVYGYIGMVSSERASSIEQGLQHNATEIVIPELPYDANCNYVWVANPKSFWLQRFKLFYNIPESTKVKLVPYPVWATTYKNKNL
ncbi:MAG: DUF6056 family protein [Clostridium sp.]|uniref:DUF6056 family protein n=1 Tax=Clostridium sp. TaxID=1506 RepID=UPI003F3FFB4F